MTKAGQKKVGKVMGEYKEGTLHSGKGGKVATLGYTTCSYTSPSKPRSISWTYLMLYIFSVDNAFRHLSFYPLKGAMGDTPSL